MSFSLNPVFSFRLNQTIVGQIKFGKFDGIHVCLTAATSTDKVKRICFEAIDFFSFTISLPINYVAPVIPYCIIFF